MTCRPPRPLVVSILSHSSHRRIWDFIKLVNFFEPDGRLRNESSYAYRWCTWWVSNQWLPMVVDSGFPIVHNTLVKLIWGYMDAWKYWNFKDQGTISSQGKAPWWAWNFRAPDPLFTKTRLIPIENSFPYCTPRWYQLMRIQRDTLPHFSSCQSLGHPPVRDTCHNLSTSWRATTIQL